MSMKTFDKQTEDITEGLLVSSSSSAGVAAGSSDWPNSVLNDLDK